MPNLILLTWILFQQQQDSSQFTQQQIWVIILLAYLSLILVNDFYYSVNFDRFDLTLQRANVECVYWVDPTVPYPSFPSTTESPNSGAN